MLVEDGLDSKFDAIILGTDLVEHIGKRISSSEEEDPSPPIGTLKYYKHESTSASLKEFLKSNRAHCLYQPR